MELRITFLAAFLIFILLGDLVHSIPVASNDDPILITGSDDVGNKRQGPKGLIESEGDLETAQQYYGGYGGRGYGGYYGPHYYHGGYGYPHYGGYGGYYGGGYHPHFGGYGGYHGGYYR